MAQQDSQNHISVAAGGNFSCFAGSCRFDGFFPGIRGLYLEQSVPNTCELTFIAKEGEERRSQKHQFPEDELRSPPMIKHGYRCQRDDFAESADPLNCSGGRRPRFPQRSEKRALRLVTQLLALRVFGSEPILLATPGPCVAVRKRYGDPAIG